MKPRHAIAYAATVVPAALNPGRLAGTATAPLQSHNSTNMVVAGGGAPSGLELGPDRTGRSQRCSYTTGALYRSSVALEVEASWKISSHGPVLTSMSLPNPTHLPAIRLPVGSASNWTAP